MLAGHHLPSLSLCFSGTLLEGVVCSLRFLFFAVIEHCEQVGAMALLGALGIATRSKDATRGSWPNY